MSNPMLMMELIRNVKVVFELNAKAGDSVLVITDSVQDPVIWTAIASAGRFYGCEVTIIMMADPRESQRTPPPQSVLESMKVTDLTISATSKEFHTGGFFTHSLDAGHKFLVMEGVTPAILLGPAVKADYRLMNEVGPKLKEVMDRAGGGISRLRLERITVSR